jgi:monolysocardiolipin acyltransferase
VHQAAVSDAVRLLDGGAWVHLFGEGRVVQPAQYALGRDGRARLGRFKWGV